MKGFNTLVLMFTLLFGLAPDFAQSASMDALPEETDPEEPVRIVTYAEKMINPSDINFSRDVATPIGTLVDRIKNNDELDKKRSGTHAVDSCHATLNGKTRFSDRIAFFVNEMNREQKPQIGYISSAYGISSNVRSHMPVSLNKFPMCGVSASTLAKTLGSKSRVPAAATIAKANEFIKRYNALRSRSLSGEEGADLEFTKLWAKLFSCLAYSESLATADSTKSKHVASKYAPPNYKKPAGVEFYEDPLQSPASRLNIGTFQFTPTARGNVQGCIRSWNELYPSCKFSTSASQSEMIRILGSGQQTFNDFCG
ncbi:MAG: hypothetical protein AB7H97_10955, partial [Pseudobdellovibrionaceae bacterium]